MIRDEWLRPLIAEIGDLREELGKVKAERDAALGRLEAHQTELTTSDMHSASGEEQRKPESFEAAWRVRLRRFLGWG